MHDEQQLHTEQQEQQDDHEQFGGDQSPPVTKPWYQSLTIWFNIVMFIVLVATELAELPTFADYRDELLVLVTVGNIFIRVFFTQSRLTR